MVCTSELAPVRNCRVQKPAPTSTAPNSHANGASEATIRTAPRATRVVISIRSRGLSAAGRQDGAGQRANRGEGVEQAVAADARSKTSSAKAARITGMLSPKSPMVAASTIDQPTSEVRRM